MHTSRSVKSLQAFPLWLLNFSRMTFDPAHLEVGGTCLVSLAKSLSNDNEGFGVGTYCEEQLSGSVQGLDL